MHAANSVLPQPSWPFPRFEPAQPTPQLPRGIPRRLACFSCPVSGSCCPDATTPSPPEAGWGAGWSVDGPASDSPGYTSPDPHSEESTGAKPRTPATSPSPTPLSHTNASSSSAKSAGQSSKTPRPTGSSDGPAHISPRPTESSAPPEPSLPGSAGRDPQNDHHPSPPNQQRQPPQHHATQPAKPDFQPRNPVHAASSVLPQSSWLVPRFEPAQPTHPTPPRDPTPVNPLLRPGRSTPHLPPSLIVNSAILGLQPFQSFLSRCGLSLGLSPHNPPTQLFQRDPTPPNPLLRAARSTPRLPPNRSLNSAILCMQPVQSFLNRCGSSLVLSPHNPPTQLLPRYPGPPSPLFRPGRSTPRLPPSLTLSPATLCMQPFQSFLSRRGSSLVLSPHNPPTQLLPRYPGPPSPLFRPGRSTPRLPPSLTLSPATLCMQPFQSFLSRRGSSLVLSPHNPPTQLLPRYPGPLNLLLLSCIGILLPRRHHTIPARRRVGGRLHRRRPSLRLTRIHLPRPPPRRPAPISPRCPTPPQTTTHHPQHHTPEAGQYAANPAHPPNPPPAPSPPALQHAPAPPHQPLARTDHLALPDAA